MTAAANDVADWEVPPEGRRSRRKLLMVGLVGPLVVAVAAGGAMYLARTATSRYQGVFQPVGQLPAATSPIMLADGRCLLVATWDVDARPKLEGWIFDPQSQTLDNVGRTTLTHVVVAGFGTPDGGALIVGDENDVGHPSLERFDPILRSFVRLPEIDALVQSPEIVSLQDGRIALLDAETTGHVYLYAPATYTFRLTGGIWEGHSGAAVAALSDNRILFAGDEIRMASGRTYNVDTGTSTATGSLVVPRYAATAVRLRDGRVLIAGGVTQDPLDHAQLVATPRAELFDPKSGTFHETGTMLKAWVAPPAALLQDGRVLLVGRSSEGNAEIYDPGTGQFTAAGSFELSTWTNVKGETALSWPKLTALHDGRVLVIAGKNLFIYH